MRRRRMLKGLGAGTIMMLSGTSGSAALTDAGDVGPNERKKECDGYRYCENCLNKHCDQYDCRYVCN